MKAEKAKPDRLWSRSTFGRKTNDSQASRLRLLVVGERSSPWRSEQEPLSPAWRRPAAGSTPSSSHPRLSKDEQLKEMEWFVNAAKPFAGMEINVVSETITTHEYEARDPRQGLHRDHRHQAQPRPHPGRRRGREDPDPDAVGPQHLRCLGQRLRPHRNALPLQAGGRPRRLDGGRRQGRHARRRST